MLQFDETTISASTVSGKELMKRSNINPANALYGKLNGLFIRQKRRVWGWRRISKHEYPRNRFA